MLMNLLAKQRTVNKETSQANQIIYKSPFWGMSKASPRTKLQVAPPHAVIYITEY